MVHISALGFGLLALDLESFEFFGIQFAMAAQASFLQCEVGEIALIDQLDFCVDESGADGGVCLVGKEAGEFELTDGADAGFEAWDAKEAPFGIGDGLDEIFFFVGGGLVFLFVTRDVIGVGGDVVGGKEDGLAGETGSDGVMGGFGFAFGGGGAGG